LNAIYDSETIKRRKVKERERERERRKEERERGEGGNKQETAHFNRIHFIVTFGDWRNSGK